MFCLMIVLLIKPDDDAQVPHTYVKRIKYETGMDLGSVFKI